MSNSDVSPNACYLAAAKNFIAFFPQGKFRSIRILNDLINWLWKRDGSDGLNSDCLMFNLE